LQLESLGHDEVVKIWVTTRSSFPDVKLYRRPVNCQSQSGPSESQPNEAPRALKLKQPKSAVGSIVTSPVLFSGVEMSGSKRYSTSSGDEDGRYGSVGGGTAVKPLVKKNLWYGLKIGMGWAVALSKTDRGGRSSN
jgi:hypothetical protein